VVEGVGVGGGTVLVHWHGGVVGEVLLVQHLEHVVAAHGEEGRPHASNIVHPDTPIGGHDLPLAGDLLRPLPLRELLSETVSNGMGRNLMAVSIQVLHLAVVSPLVGDVEGGGNGAPVGVHATTLEQFLVELLVEVVDGVVEG